MDFCIFSNIAYIVLAYTLLEAENIYKFTEKGLLYNLRENLRHICKYIYTCHICTHMYSLDSFHNCPHPYRTTQVRGNITKLDRVGPVDNRPSND